MVAPRPEAPPIPIPSPDQEKALIHDALSGSGDSYYRNCDGYDAPTSVGDAMVKSPIQHILPVINIGIRRGKPDFVEPGDIGACGAALWDLQSYPQYWMRKVSLLSARALHRLAIGDTAGALRDLDAADAAVADKDDLFFQRSLKLSMDLVRAYALRQSGDQSGADRLAIQAWRTRPYWREAGMAGWIVMGPQAPLEDLESVLRGMAQVSPAAADTLFDVTFEHGQFAKALDLYPALNPPIKQGNEPMELRDRLWLEQVNRATAEAFWAQEGGRYAYALAALGRPAGARAMLATVRQRLADATPPEPPLPDQPSIEQRTRLAVAQQGDLQIKTTVPRVIQAWGRLVEARCDVDEGRADEAWTTAMSGSPVGSWASVELVQAIAAKAPAHAAFAERLQQTWNHRPQRAKADEASALFSALPATESREQLATYRDDISWTGLVGVTGNGFTTAEDRTSGVTTIKLRSRKATLPVMEEMALLKATDLARQAGKKGVVVLKVRNINHIINDYVYGRLVDTRPDGYETQVEVIFVDPAAPPAAYQKATWRIIDADALYAALSPIYLAPAPAANH